MTRAPRLTALRPPTANRCRHNSRRHPANKPPPRARPWQRGVNFEPVLLLTRNVAQTEPVRLLQRPFFCRSCQFRTGSELTRSTIFGACQSGTGSLCFRGRINSGTGSYFGGATDFNKNIIGTGSRIRGINERPRFPARFSKEPVQIEIGNQIVLANRFGNLGGIEMRRTSGGGHDAEKVK